MSSNYPPPQQPAPGGNPFAQQPAPPMQPQGPSPYAPQQPPAGGPSPYGQQQPFNGAAYAPPAPYAPQVAPRDNVALGIVAGIVAALIAAAIYGALIKGTKHEIGYAALAVGALIGFTLGKIGGRNPVLPIVGIPLALFSVYAGQLFGIALLIAAVPGAPGVVSIFTDHFSVLQQTWKDSMDAKDIFFFAIAGLEGFVVTRRVAN